MASTELVLSGTSDYLKQIDTNYDWREKGRKVLENYPEYSEKGYKTSTTENSTAIQDESSLYSPASLITTFLPSFVIIVVITVVTCILVYKNKKKRNGDEEKVFDTETKINISSPLPKKQKAIILFRTKVLPILLALAVILQLLYVPHRIYSVSISSQKVPHYTFIHIRYGLLTEDYAFLDPQGQPKQTSQIAYDILIEQIIVTGLIGFILYILTCRYRK